MTDEIKGNEWYPRIGPGSVFAPTEIKPTMTDTPTPALDAGIVADMIMTLREISEGIDINYYGNDFEPSWEAKAASAVLSKLTSGEATE